MPTSTPSTFRASKRAVFLLRLQDAQNADVTATLTAEQLAAIKAVEVPLVVVQDPNGKNTGHATWTYTIADGAFDFLAAGETLTLTYLARVDNNYAPSNETTFVPFTIVDHRHQRQADARRRPAARSPSGSAPAIRRSIP